MTKAASNILFYYLAMLAKVMATFGALCDCVLQYWNSNILEPRVRVPVKNLLFASIKAISVDDAGG